MSENKGQKKSSLNQEAGIKAIGAKQATTSGFGQM